MQKIFKVSALALAMSLAACGGGGGSPGTTEESYSIKLRTEKNQLPLNLSGSPASQGVYSPHTTTLYVEASAGGRPIPGGENIFSCNVAGGLNSGALYYLDGKSEHEVEVDDGKGGKITVPGAYRSVTLGSNSGGNSFHFHTGNTAGVARITCTITDPRDQQQKSAYVDITVGAATAKAASIKGIAVYPLLGTQGNLNNLRTSTAIEAYVLDDANQPMPVASKANLQVAIVGGRGERLLAGQQSGSSVQVQTTGGVGTFALSSGPEEGPILLEMKSDRFDNDVTNGIQDPIIALLVINATEGNPPDVPPEPLEFVDVTPPGATNGIPYSYALSATGGVAPYTWSALGGLPEGLSLSSSGLLSGTPNMKFPGSVQVAVRLTDDRGISITGNFPLTVSATTNTDPALDPLTITMSGCGSDLNVACALNIPNPTVYKPNPSPQFHYQYALSVTGPGTGATTWELIQAPTWLELGADNGILSITYFAAELTPPRLQDCQSSAFFVKAERDGATTKRKMVINVGTPSSPPILCRF